MGASPASTDYARHAVGPGRRRPGGHGRCSAERLPTRHFSHRHGRIGEGALQGRWQPDGVRPRPRSARQCGGVVPRGRERRTIEIRHAIGWPSRPWHHDRRFSRAARGKAPWVPRDRSSTDARNRSDTGDRAPTAGLVSTDQPHQPALNLDPTCRKNPRLILRICRFESDRVALPAKALQRRFLVVDQRDPRYRQGWQWMRFG